MLTGPEYGATRNIYYGPNRPIWTGSLTLPQHVWGGPPLAITSFFNFGVMGFLEIDPGVKANLWCQVAFGVWLALCGIC